MSDEPREGINAPAVAVLPAFVKSTCGAHGGLAKDGSPCGQPVFNGRLRCGWHPEGLEGEAAAAHRSELASRGGKATMAPKRLRRNAADPRYSDPEKIISWCEVMAGKIQRGEYTDYKALDAQLKLVRIALDALGLKALNQLDQLESLVRTRLQGGAPA